MFPTGSEWEDSYKSHHFRFVLAGLFHSEICRQFVARPAGVRKGSTRVFRQPLGFAGRKPRASQFNLLSFFLTRRPPPITKFPTLLRSAYCIKMTFRQAFATAVQTMQQEIQAAPPTSRTRTAMPSATPSFTFMQARKSPTKPNCVISVGFPRKMVRYN